MKTILVTGANRGIGHAICRLLLTYSSNTSTPLRLLATSRSGNPLNLDHDPKLQTILHPQLDISDPSSLQSIIESDQFLPEGLDVLINNAGVNLDSSYPASAAQTLQINYHSTLRTCQTLLPLLRARTTPQSPSRIVNLSSLASSLKAYAPEIQARFRAFASPPPASSPHATSLSALEDIAADYLTSATSSSEATAGFSTPPRAYAVSKACVNAFTAVLARENPDILINCCCPGWVATDMGRGIASSGREPPKTAEEGARVPVRLAVGEVEGVTGAFWAERSVRGKGEGEVRVW